MDRSDILYGSLVFVPCWVSSMVYKKEIPNPFTVI